MENNVEIDPIRLFTKELYQFIKTFSITTSFEDFMRAKYDWTHEEFLKRDEEYRSKLN